MRVTVVSELSLLEMPATSATADAIRTAAAAAASA
jgi:hypothetical protein